MYLIIRDEPDNITSFCKFTNISNTLVRLDAAMLAEDSAV
jgi:hypothetical protein